MISCAVDEDDIQLASRPLQKTQTEMENNPVMLILLYFSELQQRVLSCGHVSALQSMAAESGALFSSHAAETMRPCDFLRWNVSAGRAAGQRGGSAALHSLSLSVIYCSANNTEGPVLIGTARGRDFPQPVSCFGTCESRSKHRVQTGFL